MQSRLLEHARQRVLVLDGATGSNLQALNLTVDDYQGRENCIDILTASRPDVIRELHRSFLAVGSDAVLTNTFGANQIVLAEFDLAERTAELNQRSAELARAATEEHATNTQPRFVLGSMGPGTRLPTLGQATWDELHHSYMEQVRGLLAGGVDALLIETCQDILQAKAAVVAACDVMAERGQQVPIFCTVTIETSGTMLVGTEIGAALVALEAYEQVAAFGMNCATGPQEMSAHLHYLSEHCDRSLIVQPNAGLPELVDGKACYPLQPEELARWLLEFVEVHGVNFVGGCCGTTPQHLTAVVEAVRGKTSAPRQVVHEPAVSSIYQAVTLRQDTDCLAIGERTNANGSKKFRELLAAEDIDGMVQMGREQVQQGSHLLDVCTAFVGRDEVRDMDRLIARLVADVSAPLVVDSTDAVVLETALKRAGGKCVINSINLEAGEGRLAQICGLARRYGAALIALTIDEEGMAKTCDAKVRIARRIYELATQRHGILPENLIFDPLTFTVCTGNVEDRELALETLRALPRIKEACPGAFTLLGVSNVSFGIKPAVRRVLNSVFLRFAREAGLDAAILHPSGIVPLFKIDETQRRLAEDLLFARHREDYDPLTKLLETLAGDQPDSETQASPEKVTVEERLRRRIIDGNRAGLQEDLEEVLLTQRPLDVVNEILLDAMKTVGDLFGAGQMQLPFVLQSAETMKAAVRVLEPHLDKVDRAGTRGTIVLATVAGDVHDIGKNLVDIILSNNGYTVHNLGIKQPVSSIIDAYEEQQADAIGMSGLLVKSTAVMRENLHVLNERGLRPRVLLGGAALTRKFVEEDLRAEYEGQVSYAKDAFAGLRLMEEIMAAQPEVEQPAAAHAVAAGARAADSTLSDLPPSHDEFTSAQPRGLKPAAREERAGDYVAPRSDIARDEPVPEPPFWGACVREDIDVREVLPYLNENMLFKVHWQYRAPPGTTGNSGSSPEALARPVLTELLATCEKEQILNLQAIHGYWPAQADGDRLVIYHPDDRRRKLVGFDFPRMGKPPYWCLSDFFRPASDATYDVAAFSVVTVGRRVSEVEREWFAADRYQDYLHLHGLGVELAEALAEYIHRQVRVELGIADHDARNPQELFKQRYQGARYSFGYPACPRLEDQVKLWPLLEPERINVTLTEQFQLEPEQTTTALIVHHRQARYFNVR